MDLTQLSQMVSWLDEEHRRDREELARLDQRLQSMAIEKQEQSRRIQDLESRLASTQAQLTRFTQIEQALQQLKGEVVVLLDKQTEARLNSERDAERARVTDRDALGRGIAEVRKELTRIARIEEDLVTRQAEDQRLGEMVLALRLALNNVTKDLDERTRSLPYVVEQRSQDNKRIAQIQGENTELLKRTEALAARIPMLEERLQRLDKELQRLQPIPDQLTQEQKKFIEAQKLIDVERNRQMGIWEQTIDEQKTAIERQTVVLREFEARYEQAGRSLKGIEEFQAQVVREQKQIAELQRLAEERQRKELADWQAENEQRWKKEGLRWDYVMQEQQKVNQKLAERFGPIEKQLTVLHREIEALWRLHEALGSQQSQSSQRLLDAIGAALGARPKVEA
jgi:chromosome segregation ATPase